MPQVLSEATMIQIMDAVRVQQDVRGVDYTSALPSRPLPVMWRHQAARTVARKRSTSPLRCSDCCDSSEAAPSTWPAAAAPVSSTALATPAMLLVTSPVPVAALPMLRTISGGDPPLISRFSRTLRGSSGKGHAAAAECEAGVAVHDAFEYPFCSSEFLLPGAAVPQEGIGQQKELAHAGR